MKRLHYGWIVAFLGALVFATNSLAIYGFGVFLTPLIEQFGWKRGAISLASSIAMLTNGLLGAVTGRFSDRYGPRILVTVASLSLGTAFFLMSRINSLWQVYIAWGLLVGVALGCSVVSITSGMPRWFVEKRGTAIAIPGIGFGLGAIVSPLFVQWLISSFGWRSSFFILAFIPVIVSTSAAQFMKRDPSQIGIMPLGGTEAATEINHEDSVIRGFSFREAIKTWRFWVFSLLHIGFTFSLQMIIVHIVPHQIDIGIPEITAASTLSVLASSSVVGRFLVGVLSDRIGGRRVLSGCLFLTTLSLVLLIFARQIWAFSIFAVIFGFAYGGIVPLLVIVPAELFGVKSLGAIFGAAMFLGTLGGALGSPLSGYIFDITQSYHISFLIGTILAAAATLLSLTLLRSMKE